MKTLSVQACIQMNTLKNENEIGFLELNDKTFFLYINNKILHFSKNLKWENILTLEEEYSSNIKNMRQLKNGQILCCNNNLHIYASKPKINKIKTTAMPNYENGEIIMDTIELKNGNLIGFTNQSILKIELKENKDEKDEIIQLKEIYDIFKDYIDDYLSYEYTPFLEYDLNLFELPNNNLLLHFHTFYTVRKCIRSSPIKGNKSIVFILNLNNYNIIHKFEEEIEKSNVVVLKNYICMNDFRKIYIYNINNYELINQIDIKINEMFYFIKYNKNTLIGMNENKKEVIIDSIYDVLDVNNIKSQLIKFTINLKNGDNLTNLLIYKLSNGKILFCGRKIYILEFKDKMNFMPLLETK